MSEPQCAPCVVRAYDLRVAATRTVLHRRQKAHDAELALAIDEEYQKLRAFAKGCGKVIDDE